ncbi:hypothetical protein AAG570_001539 [Ranatra chinensis]|uniref:Uncharacterized protein n=1 Tax=Ranatra chinensis TaxID=642074 RepID=A0ABD0Y8S5_9HEMI
MTISRNLFGSTNSEQETTDHSYDEEKRSFSRISGREGAIPMLISISYDDLSKVDDKTGKKRQFAGEGHLTDDPTETLLTVGGAVWVDVTPATVVTELYSRVRVPCLSIAVVQAKVADTVSGRHRNVVRSHAGVFNMYPHGSEKADAISGNGNHPISVTSLTNGV